MLLKIRATTRSTWWREVALVGLMYAGYDAVRGLRHSALGSADRHGRLLMRWDAASHLSPAHALNQLLWHVPVLAVAASYFYATLHFVVTPVALVWMYRRHPERYRFARTVLMIATLIALVGFWVFPATPPRLLPGSALHDTLADVHQWGWWSGPSSAPRGIGGLSNEYAAMPSLHVIWALWVGVLVFRNARRPFVRALGAGYPVLTALVVLGTGNHYLLDVVAGACVLGLAFLLARYALPAIARATGHVVRRIRARHVYRAFAVAATVAVATLLAHLLGSYLPDAGRELRHPHLGWLAAAVAAEFVSIGAFSQLQRAVLRAGGTQISRRRMLGLTFEANTVSGSLPAGSALAAGYSFRRFRAWGATVPAAGYTLLVSGLLSALSFGALAVAAASLAGGRSAGPLPAVLAAVLLVAVGLGLRQFSRHPEAATRLVERGAALFDRIRRHPPEPSESSARTLIGAAGSINPTVGTWSSALAYASLNWVADLACLIAAGRAVGADGMTVAVGVVVYIAGMSVSGISLTPGGLGVVEAAMILALGGSDVPRSVAIAAVLLYRAVSYLLMVVIGGTILLIRRHRDAQAAVGPVPHRHGSQRLGSERRRSGARRPGRATRVRPRPTPERARHTS